MLVLINLVRIGGVLAALLLGVSALMDVAGLVPYSEATPSLTSRAIGALPSFVAAIVLLLPFRRMIHGRRFAFLAGTLALMLAVTAGLAVLGTIGFLRGEKSWHVVPAVAILAAVPASHMWVLVRLRKRAEAGPAV